METQHKSLDFSGQNIFIGIDVHKKRWKVSILVEELEHKTFSQDPDPNILVKYLHQHFPGATYYSAYESGFCGFWIHEQLEELGVKSIVVNPADVPTTDKEKRQKRDAIDARKLAQSLRAKRLKGIFIPTTFYQSARSLIRTRHRIVRDMARCKNRIKSHLYFFGIQIPVQWEGRSWTAPFLNWLESVEFSSLAGKLALEALLSELKGYRQILAKVLSQINALSKTEEFRPSVQFLQSIPGIGLISSMVLLTEIIDIDRFKNLDHLSSFVGLIPNVHASADKERVGNITQRGNKFIKAVLIQCAWRAVREDPALLMSYKVLSKRMKKNKAIIRIAKKLLSRSKRPSNYILIGLH